MNNTVLYFFLLLILALGVDSNEASPSVGNFNIDPYCYTDVESYAMFMAAQTEDTVIPEVCQECDGKGYLGDGTVKVDCPSCDLDPLGATEEIAVAVICNCDDCDCEDCQCTEDQCMCEDCKKKESSLASTEMPYVVYYVGATWCAPCQAFKRQLNSQEFKDKGYKAIEYGESTAGAHVIKLDYDKDKNFIREKLGSLPSTVPQCYGYDNNKDKIVDRFTPAGMSWQSFTRRYMQTYKAQGYQ